MTAKTTKRRTGLSGALGSKALERVLIVAAVAAVLVAFGAWYAMARPGGTEAAGSSSSTTAPSSAAPSVETSPTPSAEAPAATTPAPPSVAAEAPAEQAGTGTPAASTTAGAPAQTAAPQTFLDEVTDSGLAPPVDDAQKLKMARDVCNEMSYGATPEDVTRALTFAGATDAEAANFVQLALTNICPEYAR
ncbi:DUF732 domain-containing protein [Blastococcus sp. CT_GayMR20]|uniref:DUF732 domain-containing protein n=1 Tax=Blastococcus sp. CT_GayMR20 TaxID=2559609 RepID=UPI00142F443D|nr:DUF732 domain-containing protein [Blastococcus sp. CT_GayMR20]